MLPTPCATANELLYNMCPKDFGPEDNATGEALLMEVHFPSIPYQNVHPIERWASIAGGIALAASGLRRPPAACAVRIMAGAGLIRRGLTGKCEIYTLLGMRSLPSGKPVPYELGVRARAAVTINQPREKVFAFLRQFENLPRVMRHLKSVEENGEGRSHWVAEGPMGKSVCWDAEILNEERDRLIAWKSLPGSQVDQAGSLRFHDAPGGRGTEVRAELQYNPPAGVVGAYVARFFDREPEQEIVADFQRLKQYLETGEIASTEDQSHGRTEPEKKVLPAMEEAMA
ncbi:MAG: SRPBCC family protein [Acidobacteria bacterium]|nr:SRPBCC family protein [Acidobacteriota bacterium]